MLPLPQGEGRGEGANEIFFYSLSRPTNVFSLQTGTYACKAHGEFFDTTCHSFDTPQTQPLATHRRQRYARALDRFLDRHGNLQLSLSLALKGAGEGAASQLLD